MALLHYVNLGVRDPRRTLDQAFYGLWDFYRYLDQSIKDLERPDAVLRVGWRKAARNSRDGEHWVELIPPKRNPDEPDQTFDQFLHEDVDEVHVVDEAPLPPKTKRAEGRRVDFGQRIKVTDRDPARRLLCLERLPEGGELVLRPNTITLKRQRRAVWALQNQPAPEHLPLLRLLDRRSYARWPQFGSNPSIDKWAVLTDASRSGTEEQRRFVEIALSTPDFAFLEGPPGSGKTTAICELVLQLVGAGKRVLVCGSTHVAVDNVLERLAPFAARDGSELVPVRIGDKRKVSPTARPFQIEVLAETERKRLVAFLKRQDPLSAAQRELLRCCSTPDQELGVERLILDCANLVCGTTTGILQHPDIKRSEGTALFDVLILDEASKTTFQEFLVPALFAKRWVIVGDVKQLSPYVDTNQFESNLAAVVPDQLWRDAWVDGFVATHKKRATVVSTTDPRVLDAYTHALGEAVMVAGVEHEEAPLAQVVIGTPEQIARQRDRLPADLGVVRGEVDDVTRSRAAANNRDRVDAGSWETELAWRMGTLFGLRDAGSGSARRLREEIDALLPADPKQLDTLHRIERVALPSILESLQRGYGREVKSGNDTALTHGIPQADFSARHVRLTYQHRMHPEIAALPRGSVYDGVALLDAAGLAKERSWLYPKYRHRAIWLHVDGRCTPTNQNHAEADAVVRELRSFVSWARANPKRSGEPWSVAVLTFYRGQERLLRDRLRAELNDRSGYAEFHIREQGMTVVRVDLCTVDRFQGHEADVVILSIAKTHSTTFLESANRMNVALTRARYQRVIIGNRHRLKRRPGTLLHELATNEPSELDFGRAS